MANDLEVPRRYIVQSSVDHSITERHGFSSADDIRRTPGAARVALLGTHEDMAHGIKRLGWRDQNAEREAERAGRNES